MAYAESLLKIAQWAPLPQSMIQFAFNDIWTIWAKMWSENTGNENDAIRLGYKDMCFFGIQ